MSRKSRVSIPRLQMYERKLSALLNELSFAQEQGYDVSRKRLCGMSRFVKELIQLVPAEQQHVFESQLKRRLVRVGHCLLGFDGTGDYEFCTAARLPSQSQYALDDYLDEHYAMLRRLADVDLSHSQPSVLSVREILGAHLGSKVRRPADKKRSEMAPSV